FTKDNSASLTTFAMDRFRQNDVKTGILVVEELLKPERSALTNAETVLTSMSEKQKYQPEIMFLWGRIAWQSIQTGNNKYSINDVQRYWEFSLKNDDKSVIYNNALGFVYYEQKLYEKANKIWFNALSLHNKNTSEIDVLNSYAGLALSLKQISLQTKDKERREKLFNESNKLYEKVITDEPVKFQRNELSRNNWLWTEKMIKDWGNLGKKD
ncbi:MAG TPA: CHAT domain-containing protein, partial [Allocoleopsis sp.]